MWTGMSSDQSGGGQRLIRNLATANSELEGGKPGIRCLLLRYGIVQQVVGRMATRTLSGAGQQQAKNVTSKRLLDFSMSGDWLGNASFRIAIPIVLAAMAYQDAASLLDRPDQVDPLHGMTNSETLRAPGM